MHTSAAERECKTTTGFAEWGMWRKEQLRELRQVSSRSRGPPTVLKLQTRTWKHTQTYTTTFFHLSTGTRPFRSVSPHHPGNPSHSVQRPSLLFVTQIQWQGKEGERPRGKTGKRRSEASWRACKVKLK